MALFDDLFKGGNVVTGLAVGIGAAVLAPVVAPMLRPLAKSLVKAGLVAYGRGREMVADLNERTGDMVAEARREVEYGGRAAPARKPD